MMKKYMKLANISMQQTIAYRSNFFISIMVTALLFLSSFFLWRAIYGTENTLALYNWNDMKSYLLVTFVCNTLLSWYSESAISRKIVSGEVALDLVKPLNFGKARLAETLGASFFEAITILVISAVLIVTLRIQVPFQIINWIAFVGFVLMGVFIKFYIVYIFSLLTFYTAAYEGVLWMRAAITRLLSGGLLPLSFFPGYMQMILDKLPFKYIVAIPADIFLGRVGFNEMKMIFLEEVLWIAALFIMSEALFKVCIRKVTIYGG